MTALALTGTNPPTAALVEPIVRRALDEDLGRAGDITTGSIVPPEKTARAALVARAGGTVAGLIASGAAFHLLDPACRLTAKTLDGSKIGARSVIAEVTGPARALLTGERTALNFLGQLSGIATLTHRFVEAVAGTKARILCTRKTTPGLRLLEKYAVRCGGGANHRMGLYDAVLIKDNHIKAAGGLAPAVNAVRKALGAAVKIEAEAETLDQLESALALDIETILLDNMRPEMLKRAVALTKGRAILEASGGVTLDTVRAIAETGVDRISVGALTHSAPALDVAMDFL